MIELLVLVAIAYAGARGVESIAGTADRRHDSPAARETVAKVADRGPKGKAAKTKEAPGPTDPGGTFSAVAPRSAMIGGKAAVPFAVVTETGSTMWKAAGEGYRERWPEIRAERRKKMAAKAARKKAAKEKAEAERKAAEALEKAGPPPAYPPRPSEPPTTPTGPEVLPPRRPDPDDPGSDTPEPGETKAKKPDGWTAWEEELFGPEPDTAPRPASGEAEESVRIAERKVEAARQEAADARAREVDAKIKAAEKGEREAKERASAAEARAREAEERARTAAETAKAAPEAEKTTPEAEIPAARRHLTVVPTPDQIGDLMSAPATLIPEIRTLDGLMNALTLTRAMCEMRAEEAEAVAADDKALSDLLDRIEGQLNEFEVDDKTRAEIAQLREFITVQSRTATAYAKAAIDTGAFASAAAGAAYKSHGGIAEAVQSSPIELAAQAGYYEN